MKLVYPMREYKRHRGDLFTLAFSDFFLRVKIMFELNAFRFCWQCHQTIE